VRTSEALVRLIGTRQKVREPLGLWVLPFVPAARNIHLVIVSVSLDRSRMRQALLSVIRYTLGVVCKGADPRLLRPGLAAVLRTFWSYQSPLNESSYHQDNGS
jgi:hypothetical protein